MSCTLLSYYISSVVKKYHVRYMLVQIRCQMKIN